MAFPVSFSNELQPLPADGLDDIGVEAIEMLATKGFEVVSGVRREDVPQIAAIAGQTSVREYCPKDLKTRFGNEALMEAWLRKENGPEIGRGMFLLRLAGAEKIAGYGWTGYEPCDELLDYPLTSAFRLHEDMQGQHLGTPFTNTIIAATPALFDRRAIGLETWGSNGPAVSTYLRAGAALIRTRDGKRPTLKTEMQDANGERQDVRLFMGFKRTLRPAA
jgi:hypothetical protein